MYTANVTNGSSINRHTQQMLGKPQAVNTQVSDTGSGLETQRCIRCSLSHSCEEDDRDRAAKVCRWHNGSVMNASLVWSAF